MRVIETVDVVLINDAELRMLTDEPSLIRAARTVMGWGPRVVVAKRGEYGAALFAEGEAFALPAFPLEDVVDPTGAGDSFAGGFLGFLAAHPDEPLEGPLLRRAMAYGTVLASFNVEQFGTERAQRLTVGRDRRARGRPGGHDAARARPGRAARIARPRFGLASRGYHRGAMDATFIFMMFVLKIPIIMLLGLVWYSIRATPDPVDSSGDGGVRRPHPHRRSPRRDPRHRGPHGGRALPPPPRVRRVHARARTAQKH